MRWAATGVGAALLFAALTGAVAAHRLTGVDAAVAHWASLRTSSAADVAASLLALPAGATLSVVWAGLLTALAWSQPPRRRVAVAGAVALAAVVAMEVLLKLLVDHPGPGPSRTVVVPALGTAPEWGGSYPSGHTCRALVLAATTTAVVRRRWVGVVAAVWLVAVVLGRVYLGEHWTSDVVGGLALGLAAVACLRLRGDHGPR